MLESAYVKNTLKPDLLREFPGIMIVRQDPNTSFQGVPDYLLLYKHTWAALETKKASKSKRQPNQPYYVEKMDGMSYAAFAHPGNHDEIMRDLKKVFLT